MLNNLVSLLGNGAAAAASSFESIATVTLSGNSSSISFTSIPSTYSHLQIRWIGRQSGANTGYGVLLRINNDSTSNYYWHRLRGNGSAASATSSGALTTSGSIGATPAANSSASIFGAGIIDFLDYANTNKYKTIRSLQGTDQNSATDSNVFFESTLYSANTNAISRIDILPDGSNFVQYSSFALYGVK